mmetsp:Transcript_10670/g.33818  ORF Transcript_10670/g.33818 Transcript_10670/m.33818 type:complete len:241 (-) Transcript_10670:113-835(-)
MVIGVSSPMATKNYGPYFDTPSTRVSSAGRSTRRARVPTGSAAASFTTRRPTAWDPTSSLPSRRRSTRRGRGPAVVPMPCRRSLLPSPLPTQTRTTTRSSLCSLPSSCLPLLRLPAEPTRFALRRLAPRIYGGRRVPTSCANSRRWSPRSPRTWTSRHARRLRLGLPQTSSCTVRSSTTARALRPSRQTGRNGPKKRRALARRPGRPRRRPRRPPRARPPPFRSDHPPSTASALPSWHRA